MHNTAHNAHSYNTQAHTAQACVRSVVHSNATVKVSLQHDNEQRRLGILAQNQR